MPLTREEVVFASKGTKQIILDTVATILDGMTCNQGKDIIGQIQGKDGLDSLDWTQAWRGVPKVAFLPSVPLHH